MKKLISIILVITLALIMSGCGEDTPRQICLDSGGDWNALSTGCTYDETYYTQEEVDEMLIKQNIIQTNIINCDNIDNDGEFGWGNLENYRLEEETNNYEIMFNVVLDVLLDGGFIYELNYGNQTLILQECTTSQFEYNDGYLIIEKWQDGTISTREWYVIKFEDISWHIKND